LHLHPITYIALFWVIAHAQYLSNCRLWRSGASRWGISSWYLFEYRHVLYNAKTQDYLGYTFVADSIGLASTSLT